MKAVANGENVTYRFDDFNCDTQRTFVCARSCGNGDNTPTATPRPSIENNSNSDNMLLYGLSAVFSLVCVFMFVARLRYQLKQQRKIKLALEGLFLESNFYSPKS